MRPVSPALAKPPLPPTRTVPPIPASPDSACRPRRLPPVPEVPKLPAPPADSYYVRKKLSPQAGDGPHDQRPVQKVVPLLATRLRNQHTAVTCRPMQHPPFQYV